MRIEDYTPNPSEFRYPRPATKMAWPSPRRKRKTLTAGRGRWSDCNGRLFLSFYAKAAVCGLLLLAGCARFSTTQTDISTTNPYGEPQRTITTKASSYTFFSANSKLATWKASQTDKTQGASVGGLEQSSTGTNVVAALSAIAEILKAVK